MASVLFAVIIIVNTVHVASNDACLLIFDDASTDNTAEVETDGANMTFKVSNPETHEAPYHCKAGSNSFRILSASIGVIAAVK
jgi:uncharacterized protein YfaP (DUF2135 family)